MPDQPPVVDALSAPLGQGREPRRQRSLPRLFPYAATALLAVVPLGFFGWIMVADDPLGGEPVAIVSTSATPEFPKSAEASGARTEAVATQKAPPEPPVNEAGSQTVTIIDGMSGARRHVTIAPAAVSAPPAPAAGPLQTNPAEPKPASEKKDAAGAQPDQMLERSRHGVIPKIAPDGARPFDAYSSRHADAGRTGAPRIAIVVGRLGVSASLATEALAKLPAPVTLSFTPYGADLERWTARAARRSRDSAAGADGAVRLSRQRSRSPDDADVTHAPPKY